MASLTILPEANQSASQDLLQRLPSSNQLITESRKNRVIITKWLASRDALNYASVMLNLLRTGPLNPGGVLQELAQAKQIWEEKGTSTFYAFEAQLQWLELTYTLREPREVLSFRDKNKFLMPLLIEARFKISRAYYAAFCKARNHLRDKENRTLSEGPEAHAEVQDKFILSSDRRRREIGENLNRLRTFRNRADYRDIFSGLTNTTITSIELADDVISDISRL